MIALHGRVTRIALAATPLVALCLAGLAAAQGTRPQPAPPRNQPGQVQNQPGQIQQRAPHQNLDPLLALEIALENDNEVILAKFAQTRADSKDVVKFAETLQKDHEQYAKDLQRFAGDIAARREPQENRPNDGRRNPEKTSSADAGAANRREANPPQAQGAPRAQAPQAQGAPPRAPEGQANPQQPGHMNVFEQIKFELADACRDSAERELREQKGAEFDKCYLGMQLGAHMRMIDTLTVYERHSSPELQQVLHKGLETSRKHFDEAKKLMKGVEDNVRTARRDKNS